MRPCIIFRKMFVRERFAALVREWWRKQARKTRTASEQPGKTNCTVRLYLTYSRYCCFLLIAMSDCLCCRWKCNNNNINNNNNGMCIDVTQFWLYFSRRNFPEKYSVFPQKGKIIINALFHINPSFLARKKDFLKAVSRKVFSFLGNVAL